MMGKRLWIFWGLMLLIFTITIPVWGESLPEKNNNEKSIQDQASVNNRPPAGSWELKSGDEVISKTQVIEGDLFFSGDRLEVDGIVRGDLVVYAGEVVVNGQVNGNVIGGVWGNFTLNGTIGENLRLLANELDLNGVVKRSVTVGVSQFQTAAGSRVEGGLLGYFLSSGRLTGEIEGPVNIGSMNIVEIGGRIRGNVKTSGLRINWLTPVEITGTVADHSQMPENPAKTSRMKVGKYQYYEPNANDQLQEFKSQMMLSFTMFIGGLLLSLIFYRLFPRTAWTISEPSPVNFKANFLVGLLGFIGIPLLSLILYFTMMGLGIPVAIFLLLVYVLLLFFAWAPVYLWFGRLVFKSRLKPSVMIVFGGLILMLIGLIPIFSFILQILFTIQGMGMVLRNIKPQYKELIDVKA